MTRSHITAWILIIAGGLLFLNYFDLLNLSRANTSILISVFLAILFFAKTIQNKSRKGIFGFTFFALSSALLLLMNFGLIPIDDRLGSGILIAILAISNLVNFIFSSRKISQLILTFIFAAIALPFFIAYYKVIPIGIVGDYYETFWPAVLIIIGLLVIIDGYVKRRRRPSDSQEPSFHG